MASCFQLAERGKGHVFAFCAIFQWGVCGAETKQSQFEEHSAAPEPPGGQQGDDGDAPQTAAGGRAETEDAAAEPNPGERESLVSLAGPRSGF